MPIFTSKLLMGTAADSFNVILDTGSDWTVIAGVDCKSCTGNTFDPQVSGTAVDKETSTKMYGSATLGGKAYKDRACFGVNCASDFEYFLVS